MFEENMEDYGYSVEGNMFSQVGPDLSLYFQRRPKHVYLCLQSRRAVDDSPFVEIFDGNLVTSEGKEAHEEFLISAKPGVEEVGFRRILSGLGYELLRFPNCDPAYTWGWDDCSVRSDRLLLRDPEFVEKDGELVQTGESIVHHFFYRGDIRRRPKMLRDLSRLVNPGLVNFGQNSLTFPLYSMIRRVSDKLGPRDAANMFVEMVDENREIDYF